MSKNSNAFQYLANYSCVIDCALVLIRDNFWENISYANILDSDNNVPTIHEWIP